MPSPQKTFYEILGVSPSAPIEEIARAARQRLAALHPDRCTAANREEEFETVKRAQAILCDVHTRHQYDARLKAPIAQQIDNVLLMSHAQEGHANGADQYALVPVEIFNVTQFINTAALRGAELVQFLLDNVAIAEAILRDPAITALISNDDLRVDLVDKAFEGNQLKFFRFMRLAMEKKVSCQYIAPFLPSFDRGEAAFRQEVSEWFSLEGKDDSILQLVCDLWQDKPVFFQRLVASKVLTAKGRFEVKRSCDEVLSREFSDVLSKHFPIEACERNVSLLLEETLIYKRHLQHSLCLVSPQEKLAEMKVLEDVLNNPNVSPAIKLIRFKSEFEKIRPLLEKHRLPDAMRYVARVLAIFFTAGIILIVEAASTHWRQPHVMFRESHGKQFCDHVDSKIAFTPNL